MYPNSDSSIGLKKDIFFLLIVIYTIKISTGINQNLKGYFLAFISVQSGYSLKCHLQVEFRFH